MEVRLVDHMGSDLSVVNAARVSFAKTSEWDVVPDAGPVEGYLKVDDERLIKYLAKHNHWSPFGHASMQFHIKAPVFVARQLVKHQVGLVWNEVSRRYVDDEVEFYEPTEWRLAAENKKQGSSDETVPFSVTPTHEWCRQTYKNLLNAGKKADELNKASGFDKFVGVTVGGGLGAGAVVMKAEDIGTFGDFIDVIPTKLDREEKSQFDALLEEISQDTFNKSKNREN